MATFKIGRVELGDTVFKNNEGRFILAKDAHTAKLICSKLRVDDDVSEVCSLNADTTVLHRNGFTVFTTHRDKSYELDTVLVFGSPRGLNTTCSNKVVYKR